MPATVVDVHFHGHLICVITCSRIRKRDASICAASLPVAKSKYIRVNNWKAHFRTIHARGNQHKRDQDLLRYQNELKIVSVLPLTSLNYVLDVKTTYIMYAFIFLNAAFYVQNVIENFSHNDYSIPTIWEYFMFDKISLFDVIK